MQSPIINWDAISMVFLDMDGTLLDLYFDNYFWNEYVPLRFSEKNAIDFEQARRQLLARYKSKAGSLDWYCIDYWEREFELDMVALKLEISDYIRAFPHTEKFLSRLKANNKYIALLTNAHRKSVALKMDRLHLEHYFDKIVSAHDYGYVKEQQAYWHALMQAEPFHPGETLFIDDNLAVLQSAEAFGIKHLLSIKQPDSTKAPQDTRHFHGLTNFEEIMPGVPPAGGPVCRPE